MNLLEDFYISIKIYDSFVTLYALHSNEHNMY